MGEFSVAASLYISKPCSFECLNRGCAVIFVILDAFMRAVSGTLHRSTALVCYSCRAVRNLPNGHYGWILP